MFQIILSKIESITFSREISNLPGRVLVVSQEPSGILESNQSMIANEKNNYLQKKEEQQYCFNRMTFPTYESKYLLAAQHIVLQRTRARVCVYANTTSSFAFLLASPERTTAFFLKQQKKRQSRWNTLFILLVFRTSCFQSFHIRILMFSDQFIDISNMNEILIY